MTDRPTYAARRGRLWILALAGAWLAVCPLAAQDAPRDGDSKRESRGLWPSDRLIDLWFQRVARDMSRDYGFDEYQQQQTQELMSRHFKDFLNRNRGQLETLIMEFAESQLAEEPPSPEFAADWAQRALPLVNDFQGLMTGMTDEMRDYMTEDQEALLDVNLSALDVAVGFVDRRLNLFAEGGFEPEIHWTGNRKVRRMSEVERKQVVREAIAAREAAISRMSGAPATGAGGGGAPVPVAAAAPPKNAAPAQPGGEKDEWARYVDEFIVKFKLNDEQQQQARSFLQDQYAERDKFYERNAHALERLSGLFAKAKSDAEVDKAETQYQKLMAPVDNMFEVLKKKLDRLPTRAQRSDWALAEEAKRHAENDREKPRRE